MEETIMTTFIISIKRIKSLINTTLELLIYVCFNWVVA